MRKIILLSMVVLLPLSLWGYVGSGILINEVRPQGDGTSDDPDWIELYNNSSSTINIENYVITSQNELTWDEVWKEKNAKIGSVSCKNNSSANPADCDYIINFSLNVDPGCYVVLYSTSGTNDTSCSGDNKIEIYMNLGNIWDTTADDVLLIAPVDYLGNTRYLAIDYVAWDTDSRHDPNEHPTKCGTNHEIDIDGDGTVDDYSDANFKVHVVDDNDVSDQCSDATDKNDVPVNYDEDDSTKKMTAIDQPLSSTYSRNPNGSDTDSSSDFVVADDTPGTTASFLEYFKVIPQGEKVILVDWRTGFEDSSVQGFNILESTSRDGEYVKRNGALIKAKRVHSEYAIVLRILNPSPVLYYKLEVVRKNGENEVYGPVSISLSTKGSTVANSGRTPLAVNGSSSESSSGCSHIPVSGILGVLLLIGFVIVPFRRVFKNKK